MLTRIFLLLATSLSLLVPAGAQYGQERPRRVNPPVENTATPPPASPAGSSLHVVDAQAGDTLRKIAARERVPLDELERVNGVDPDTELEEGREVRFYSHTNDADNVDPDPQVSQSSTQARHTSRARSRRSSGARGRSARSARTPSRGGGSSSDYYNNVDGERVRRPVFSRSAPSGATAHCRDGSYSFSRHRRGTCSHHGGVAQWL
jgi:LysM repeat protein